MHASAGAISRRQSGLSASPRVSRIAPRRIMVETPTPTTASVNATSGASITTSHTALISE